ncbi:TOBE domain-containing protein [Pseudaminobacter soli (ex Zhang et al. 2022)]|uniref:TOBE domain-containing protein n=1 Tax=Pseudaminobacter soli (ex Zhang et al. 2022) TaxID=2831468 RepID=UPI001F00D206|nr:TOBE domain-containing protein [Pseudaminobacter soli]
MDASGEFWPPVLKPHLAPGETITILYRPEHIGVAQGVGGLAGRIETTTFLGPVVRLTIKLASGRIVIVDRPSHEAGHLWARGMTVSLKPDAQRAVIIAGENLP